MRKGWLAGLALVAFLVTGCAAGGKPLAVTPETSHDFGQVKMSNDPKDVKRKQFVIRNEGKGNLKLEPPQVKTLQGC